MKKLLGLIVASAFISSPALAQEDSGLKLDVTGYFKGYTVYNDQDGDARNVDIIRDTELHFVGSTTLDNGLTVGADVGIAVDQGNSSDITDSFVYFSGDWGRFNVGATDNATYLLQVSAPTADANYDGMDQYYTPMNYDVTGVTELSDIEFDYDQDVSVGADKLTYFTPNVAGFQAALSWTPKARDASRDLTGVDTNVASLVDIVDGAVRFDQDMSFGKMSLGGGYTMAEERTLYNVGADFDIGAFGVGAVYTHDDQDEAATAGATGQRQWIAGVDYTAGAFVYGVSYLNQKNEFGADDIDTDRYTAGVTYKYAPGVDFRGIVTHLNHDVDAALGDDVDGTGVMLGTSLTF